MTSFRVTIVFWNGSIRTTDSNVNYIRGRHKLFACKLNMDLNECILLIVLRLELTPQEYC